MDNWSNQNSLNYDSLQTREMQLQAVLTQPTQFRSHHHGHHHSHHGSNSHSHEHSQPTTTPTLTPCTGLSGYVTCSGYGNCSDPNEIVYTSSDIDCFGTKFTCSIPITSTTGCLTCALSNCSNPGGIFYSGSNVGCFPGFYLKCSNA